MDESFVGDGRDIRSGFVVGEGNGPRFRLDDVEVAADLVPTLSGALPLEVRDRKAPWKFSEGALINTEDGVQFGGGNVVAPSFGKAGADVTE